MVRYLSSKFYIEPSLPPCHVLHGPRPGFARDAAFLKLKEGLMWDCIEFSLICLVFIPALILFSFWYGGRNGR